MDSRDVAAVCLAARDLIIRDGWTPGGEGWHGEDGWCIEGALGTAMGLDIRRHDSMSSGEFSDAVNASPAGRAVAQHLKLGSVELFKWNDRSATKAIVLEVLMAVALTYTPKVPLWERILRGYQTALGVEVPTGTTSPPEDPPEPSGEPSEEDAPAEEGALVSV